MEKNLHSFHASNHSAVIYLTGCRVNFGAVYYFRLKILFLDVFFFFDGSDASSSEIKVQKMQERSRQAKAKSTQKFNCKNCLFNFL